VIPMFKILFPCPRAGTAQSRAVERRRWPFRPPPLATAIAQGSGQLLPLPQRPRRQPPAPPLPASQPAPAPAPANGAGGGNSSKQRKRTDWRSANTVGRRLWVVHRRGRAVVSDKERPNYDPLTVARLFRGQNVERMYILLHDVVNLHTKQTRGGGGLVRWCEEGRRAHMARAGAPKMRDLDRYR
jgi:hypothetical protein